MIKAVVFDLDNTVYDYDWCHNRAMNNLKEYACQKYKLCEFEFYEAFDKARKEVKEILGDTGASHNRMLYMQLFLENIKEKPTKGALELYNIYWDSMLSDMELFEYVITVLKDLQNRGITIGVLTDLTAQIQHRKIRKLNLIDFVDVLVTSEEAGVEKPSRIAFERIMNKLQCEADEVLMIGDSQEKDVDGAIQSGMHGLLFEKKNASDMDKRIMEFINDKMV